MEIITASSPKNMIFKLLVTIQATVEDAIVASIAVTDFPQEGTYSSASSITFMHDVGTPPLPRSHASMNYSQALLL